MDIPSLRQSYLVGGTALSLLYGHRVSIDLDLFYHQAIDTREIIGELSERFRHDFSYLGGPNTFGLFCSVHNVKVDIIHYQHPLIHDTQIIDGIRMYHTDDIVAMKLHAILGRGKKKDFWDIAELLKHYSLEHMMALHAQKYPSQQLLVSIPQALVYFDDANESEDPVSLNGETWESIQKKIAAAVRTYLS